MHNLASYAGAMAAWLQMRAGDWEQAERAATAELQTSGTMHQPLIETILSELAIR